MRNPVCWLWMLLALPLGAAERKFDFSDLREGEVPSGFRSAVMGTGKPGDWKVVWDEVPPLLPPLTPQATSVSKRPVLAQLAQDPGDEHFPMFIYQGDTFDDFKLTVRFKTVRGAVEQMAGVVFRLQNETNFYVVRASTLGNNFRFYKVVNGDRGTLIGPSVPVPAGIWHELSVECKGNQILCGLDGKDLIPMLSDNTFQKGKIGFWTKSDSVSYFTDLKVVFKPREPPARGVLQAVLKDYPRLLGLKIYVPGKEPGTTRVVASKDPADVGQPGGKTEREVLRLGEMYYGTEGRVVSVIAPLTDRNGDPMAVVRVMLKAFSGQTEQNALARALPIAKAVQSRLHSLDDLVE
jgi:hypothetical protein